MNQSVQIGLAALRLEAVISDLGSPVTGLTGGNLPTVAIRRLSDNFFLDFNDSTFKASGWTTQNQPLAEVTGEANMAGTYSALLDTSAIITEQGMYAAHYAAKDVTPNQLDVDLLHFVESDLAEKILVNKLVIDEGASALNIYEKDGTTIAATWNITDKDGATVVLQGTGPANRSPA